MGGGCRAKRSLRVCSTFNRSFRGVKSREKNMTQSKHNHQWIILDSWLIHSSVFSPWVSIPSSWKFVLNLQGKHTRTLQDPSILRRWRRVSPICNALNLVQNVCTPIGLQGTDVNFCVWGISKFCMQNTCPDLALACSAEFLNGLIMRKRCDR